MLQNVGWNMSDRISFLEYLTGWICTLFIYWKNFTPGYQSWTLWDNHSGSTTARPVRKLLTKPELCWITKLWSIDHFLFCYWRSAARPPWPHFINFLNEVQSGENFCQIQRNFKTNTRIILDKIRISLSDIFSHDLKQKTGFKLAG